jgi:hypothetical protein
MTTTHAHQKTKLSSYGRLGILLGGIGVLMAIDTLANISIMYKFWPLIPMLLGIGFIGIYLRRGRREGIYIGVGAYIIGFSGLALFCSLTSWASIATLWPLFIGLLGLSFLFGFFFGSRRPVMLLAGLLFVSLAILFFSVFGISRRQWWIVFILAGMSFFVFDKVRRS